MIVFSEYCIVHSIILLIVANTNQIDAIIKWHKSLFHVNSSCKFDDGEKLPRLLIPTCHLVRPHLSLSWSIFLSSKECWNSLPGSWPQVGPMLAPWTLLSGKLSAQVGYDCHPCGQWGESHQECLVSKEQHWSIANFLHNFFDNKVHGVNMGPIWGRQDPGRPPGWAPCWPHEPCYLG